MKVWNCAMKTIFTTLKLNLLVVLQNQISWPLRPHYRHSENKLQAYFYILDYLDRLDFSICISNDSLIMTSI